MKLAGVFISLINVATLFIASDVIFAANPDSTTNTKILQENDFKMQGLAYVNCRREKLHSIKNLVDDNLELILTQDPSTGDLELKITGLPNSVYAVENLLRVFTDNLISDERTMSYSRPKWKYLRLVQKKINGDKNSSLLISLMPKKIDNTMSVWVTATPGDGKLVSNTIKYLGDCIREEAIPCPKYKLSNVVNAIKKRRQELANNDAVACIEQETSTIHVAGADPGFAQALFTIKGLIEGTAEIKEEAERVGDVEHVVPKRLSKKNIAGDEINYVLVENHDRVTFDAIADEFGRKLSVRVGEIIKSPICPGYLQVPFPQSHYVVEALAIKSLDISIDGAHDQASLKIIDPRKTSAIKYNMGFWIKKNSGILHDQATNLVVSKHELLSLDAVARAVARVFKVAHNQITVVEQDDGYHVHSSSPLDKMYVPENSLVKLTWDDFVQDHAKFTLRLDAQ